MNISHIHHIGIAAPSIRDVVPLYRDLFGAAAVHEVFELPAHGARICLIDAPNIQLELIEPYGENSPILAFLRKHPAGGQHHICFEVANLAEAVVSAAASGAVVLGEPRIGAHGAPVVFLHPRQVGGVLVELMESRCGSPCSAAPVVR